MPYLEEEVYWAAAGRANADKIDKTKSAGMADVKRRIVSEPPCITEPLAGRGTSSLEVFSAIIAIKKPARSRHVVDVRLGGRLQRANRVIIANGSGMLYRMNESVRIDQSVPVKGKTLRAIKGIAIAVLAAVFTLALGWPRELASLWAQTAATNPLIAPVPPPAAPSQLPAPVTTAIAPILEPVSPLPSATPTPSERVFNCSCFGHGTRTNWIGQVSALGYFAARQSAVGACETYNERREPQSPLQSTGSSATVPVLPGSAIPGSATQLGSTLPGTLNASSAEEVQLCANCVCD